MDSSLSLPICWLGVLESLTALGISRGYFKHELAALVENDVCRPDLDIDWVDLSRNDREDI